jgi:hypothetical protein
MFRYPIALLFHSNTVPLFDIKDMLRDFAEDYNFKELGFTEMWSVDLSETYYTPGHPLRLPDMFCLKPRKWFGFTVSGQKIASRLVDPHAFKITNREGVRYHDHIRAWQSCKGIANVVSPTMVTSIIDLREDSSIGDYLITSTVLGVGVGIGVGAATATLGTAATPLL